LLRHSASGGLPRNNVLKDERILAGCIYIIEHLFYMSRRAMCYRGKASEEFTMCGYFGYKLF
jgi:hypothetical protein